MTRGPLRTSVRIDASRGTRPRTTGKGYRKGLSTRETLDMEREKFRGGKIVKQLYVNFQLQNVIWYFILNIDMDRQTFIRYNHLL